MKKEIAVDLDGTLAEYHGWDGIDVIGAPIQIIVDKVIDWLAEGHSVTVFTARASDPDAIPYIKEWCYLNIGIILPITNIKHKKFKEFWDDRAISVECNTGYFTDANALVTKCGKVDGPAKDSALDVQVGGGHYKDMKIQPVEFCHANKMGGIESAVVKYVSRHRFKNGIEDINKAIHLLEILKQLEYK